MTIDTKRLTRSVMDLNDGWYVKGPVGLGNVLHIYRSMTEHHGKFMVYPDGALTTFGERIDFSAPTTRRLLETIWQDIDAQNEAAS